MNPKRNNFIEKIFENMYQSLDSMFNDGQFSFPLNMESGKPYFYGYTMQVGPDGKPVIHEYGNLDQAGLSNSSAKAIRSDSEYREPIVDVFNDQDGKVRLIAELPGIVKDNIKITENQGVVTIKAENGERKYQASIPTGKRLDSSKSKTKFNNGVLELEIPVKKSDDEKNIRIE
jgi:HSP20 family protein